MIPFNFHHLYYFYIIAKEGTILKASQILRLGQPALSMQLKQFEDFLAKRLFEREGRKLILTEEGHYVYAYAQMIFEIGQEFMDGFKDLEHKGRIKIQIGVSSYVPKTFVHLLLQYILLMEPAVRISLFENEVDKLTKMLEDFSLDLVVSDSPYQSQSVESAIEHHLVGDTPVIFCSHPKVASKIKRFPQDLDGAPMIFPTAQSQIYKAVQEYLIKHRVTPKVIAEIQDLELVRRLVLNGYGIAPINQLTVMRAPAKERLVILDKSIIHTIRNKTYLLIKKRKKNHPLIPKILTGFRLREA